MRTVYTIFLGTLLALFVGLGISTVHPGPQEPEPSPAAVLAVQTVEPTEEQLQARVAYERDRDAWEDAAMAHSRDVGLVALVSSVLLLVLGLLIERRRPVLAQGAVLGGLLTLVHSVVRSLVAQDTLATFAVVTVALAVVLFLGYRRFVDRPTDPGDRSGPPQVVVSRNGKHPSRP